MEKDNEVMDAFGKLGTSQIVPSSVKKSLNRYTCTLYGARGTCEDVNRARHTLLLKKVPQNKTNIPSKLKSFDPATLPPCLSALEQKISRVNFVSHVWTNAHKPDINEWDPLKHGWVKEETTGNLVPKWFEGDRVPNNLFYEETEMGNDNLSESDDGGEDNDKGSNSESDDYSDCDIDNN